MFWPLSNKTKSRMKFYGGSTFTACCGLGGLAAIIMPAGLPVIAGAVFVTGAIGGGLAAGAGHFSPIDYPPDRSLRIGTAKESQISIIHEKLRGYAGANLIDISERLAIFERNKECFQVVIGSNAVKMTEEILGMIVIYPLNSDAWGKMSRGVLSGAEIRARHVVKSPSRATAIYISFVWGQSLRKNGFVVRELERILKKWSSDSTVIATRPTTPEAMRHARDRGLADVRTGHSPVMDQICCAEYSDLRARSK